MPVKGTTKTTYRRAAKAGVIRRRMRGETTREIAKAERIARNTVIRILSLPEVQEARAKSRGLILARADEMSERLVQMALGETSKGDRQALVDILRGIGVLTSKLEVQETIPQERTYSFPRVAFFWFGTVCVTCPASASIRHVDCFRVARNSPGIDAKCGDHFL